jgi:osmotically-inducible protein OsmY
MNRGGKMEEMDALIKTQVENQLRWDTRVDASELNVDVNEGLVALRGSVESYAQSVAACDAANAIGGVRGVNSYLRVGVGPPSEAVSDDRIRQDAEHLLSHNTLVHDSAIRVSVADGVVRLEGSLNQHWKLAYAEELVSPLIGVADVENHLTVVPAESLADARIAEDIESALQRTFGVSEKDVTVSVEKGQVVLGGMANDWQERRTAERTASRTVGVVNVDNRILVRPGQAE